MTKKITTRKKEKSALVKIDNAGKEVAEQSRMLRSTKNMLSLVHKQ